MLGKDNSKHKEKNHMSDRKVENKRENETGKNKGSPKVCRMNRLNTM